LLKSAGLQSDALIVPHHGSKTSSTVDFVQAVGAKYSVFTVGYLNRFKHPKPLIEKRFEENGAFTYRSDYQGAILIDFKKNNPIKMTAWRQSQPRYWHDSY
jgi:competence protein ComEC